MANPRTVLSRKGLIQPLDGAAWSADGDANWALLDGNVAFMSDLPPAAGYAASAGSGLTLNVAKGVTFSAGTLQSYPGGTLTLTDAATNYVYLDPASGFQPAANTTGFASGVIPVATVVCASGAISSVTDNRPEYVLPYGTASANQVLAGPASGSAAIPAARALVASDIPLASLILIGADTSKPAAGVTGRLYFATDTTKIYRDNGATWDDATPTSLAASGQNFADAEIPSGAEGTAFTLAHTPTPAASLILVWDGLVRKAGTDYTLTGTAITTSVSINPASSNLMAWYRY